LTMIGQNAESAGQGVQVDGRWGRSMRSSVYRSTHPRDKSSGIVDAKQCRRKIACLGDRDNPAHHPLGWRCDPFLEGVSDETLYTHTP
jgi:hypothetical protein